MIAFFVFATAILFVAVAADFALRQGRRTLQENRAALVAQSRLAQVRSWCHSVEPSPVSGFAAYPGLGSWQADQYGYESRVQMVVHHTYSPSSNSEIFLPADRRRSLDSSLLRVRVEVRWGSLPTQSLKLVSLISDRRRSFRAINPVVVTPLSGATFPLAQGATADFQAEAFNDLGQLIGDAMFSWSVIPGTSLGMLDSQRADGKQCQFINHVLKVPGPGFDFAGPGECWVVATTRYWGVEQVGRYLVELL